MNRLGRNSLTLLLTVAVTVSCLPPINVMAEESEVLSVEESAEFIGIPKYPTSGLIVDDTEAPIVEETDDMLGITAAFPGHYDSSRYKEAKYNSDYIAQLGMMPVRNQGSFGTCWAFAPLSAAEAAAINSDEFDYDKDSIDLSEWQIAYYCGNRDGSKDRSKDGVSWKVNDPNPDYDTITSYANGGSLETAYLSMMDWTGAVSEEKQGYPTGNTNIDCVAAQRSDDLLHLSGYSIINIEGNANLIKKAVATNGAVAIGYCAESEQSKYYNEDKACQYIADENRNPNHAVTVVGWDDNYSKENFGGDYYQLVIKDYVNSSGEKKTITVNISNDQYLAIRDDNNYKLIGNWSDNLIQYVSSNIDNEEIVKITKEEGARPNSDGAWLIRNSWGDYDSSLSDYVYDESGNVSGKRGTGYFWLSYEDKSFIPYCVIPEVEPLDEHDNIYSYDGTIYERKINTQQSTACMANVFRLDADKNDSNVKSEIIDSIAFKTAEANLTYRILLFGFEDGSYSTLAAPWSGEELGEEIIGVTGPAGYIKVDLPYELTVSCGTTVAVCLILTNEKGTVSAIVEKPSYNERIDFSERIGLPKDTVYADRTVTTDGQPGESWLLLNGEWVDLNADFDSKLGTNLRIKMYTSSSDRIIESIGTEDYVEFDDVDDSKWYRKAVNDAVKFRIMSGVSEDKFAPEDECSRTMMVTILNNMAAKQEAPEGTANPFKDVENNKWYTKPVIWAYANGLTKGVSATKFGVKSDLTREQVATLLYSFAKRNKYDVSKKEDLKKFKDAKEISSWSEEALSWAAGNGIVSGKSGKKLDPKGTATRAEVAQMAVNFAKAYMTMK